MKKIGILGGSFDPIHFGHLNLAVQMKEIHQLDQVLFCPTFCSPHKIRNPPKAKLNHRMEMVFLAIQGEKSFAISDKEAASEISYTFDTLVEFQKEFLNSRLFLILGEDILETFHTWKNAKEILKIATLLVGHRKECLEKPPAGFEALKKGFTKIQAMEISSSGIRERLKKRFYCAHLVPYRVLEYIDRCRLYKT